MGYDARSQLVRRVDAQGRATYLAYDAAGRNTQQRFTAVRDAVAALVKLEFSRRDAARMVAAAQPGPDWDAARIVRAALQGMPI